ncbi:hypothetical protein [uncultured Shimia sp.]|uniref:hypothetical protein n=1 Tax=uncultured Shimia sp. TaxID=573152 RepID=UPI00260DFB3C|nr:hypothetical protein [uncultured Shimia sp.]
MTGLALLAIRNLQHNKVRSAVLIFVLTIVTSIPVLANLVISQAERDLMARAQSTPLVYGAQGSPIDLVLGSAYFSDQSTTTVKMADYLDLIDLSYFALAPMRRAGTIRGLPFVGVDYEYFIERGLRPSEGFLPLRVGDVVLGHAVAQKTGLTVGGELRTDATQAFDLAGSYPVTLRVSGILPRTNSPDDGVVFADLRTAWIAEGIGHGHQELTTSSDPNLLLKPQNDALAANSSLPTYTDLTQADGDAFHYHGADSDLPLSAVLVFPRSPKAEALLKGRVAEQQETRQLVDVENVIQDLLTRVFQMKSILQNVVATMAIATIAALFLVVVLSVRMRRREFEIANQIGAPKKIAVYLVAMELVILLSVALALTLAISGAVYIFDIDALSRILVEG